MGDNEERRKAITKIEGTKSKKTRNKSKTKLQ